MFLERTIDGKLLLIDHPDLVVLNRKKGIINNITSVEPIDPLEENDKKEIKEMTKSFFQNISKSDYQRAFELLDHVAKERLFESNLHYFADFFNPTKLIDQINVFGVVTLRGEQNLAYAKVYFIEEREIISLPENPLYSIGSNSNLEDYIREVNNILEKGGISKEDCENISEWIYTKIDLATNLSLYLRTNIKNILRMFPETKIKDVHHLMSVTYSNKGKGWQIHEIVPLQADQVFFKHIPDNKFDKRDSYKYCDQGRGYLRL